MRDEGAASAGEPVDEELAASVGVVTVTVIALPVTVTVAGPQPDLESPEPPEPPVAIDVSGDWTGSINGGEPVVAAATSWEVASPVPEAPYGRGPVPVGNGAPVPGRPD